MPSKPMPSNETTSDHMPSNAKPACYAQSGPKQPGPTPSGLTPSGLMPSGLMPSGPMPSGPMQSGPTRSGPMPFVVIHSDSLQSDAVLPDHLAPGLGILFCGTAAGPTSAALGHYYARQGNRFWGLLAIAGLTPRVLTPQEDHLMPGLGFGLTDLAKGMSGVDKHIPESAYVPERLALLVDIWQPRAVAFTSLKAARTALQDKSLAAGRLADSLRWPKVALWALPSPSGANGHFDAAPWRALGAWHRHGGGTGGGP